MNFSFLGTYYTFFLQGMYITFLLAVISVIAGTVLGIILTLMRRSQIKVIKWISIGYIEFIRGTPLLAQIFLVYVGLPMILQVNVPDFLTGAIALTIHASAYISETMRSGIEAIPYGQTEAARSLGMSKRRTMIDIILPQAFKNILPALGNQFIGNIKDSSLVSVIGISELMYQTTTVRGTTALGLEPIIVASFIYLVMTLALTRLLSHLERRLKSSDYR
ncbi:amino acid ABC transporter permease [Sporolactobacillus inulinus]|uniref:Arginine ABC transporter permease n=3 Tax=Sporolactobacillus inulinus TaxID=2078 RepID=A0A0U1QS15_9BACL|nr:amino acid ABC transporter permease [Sporolactobacillus inulinus]KLI03588.1 arginine ABC transporter permease [Sporolactobacillus inulinus CASD]GEB78340.1 amino acid ABC transporter permease [Sporolactobacillus inulinus]